MKIPSQSLRFAVALGLVACGGGNPEPASDILPSETHVVFENLQDAMAIAELRSDVDDSTLASLHWNAEASVGILKILADRAELSLQGVDPNDFARLEEGLLHLYDVYRNEVALLNDEAVGPDEAVTQSALSGSHPTGYLDWVRRTDGVRGGFGCVFQNVTYQARGWAVDPNRSSQSIWVHLYATGWGPRKYLGGALANRSRNDVNRALGISGRHGFVFTLPEGWDGDQINTFSAPRNLRLRAYGINVAAGANRELRRSNQRYGAHGPEVLDSTCHP